MSQVEMDTNGVAERATMQESEENTSRAGCSSAKGTGVLHQCRMTQRGVQRCETQGVVAAGHGLERELQHQEGL